MDSFDVGALASEPLVVFCVATAGKGRSVDRFARFSPCRAT